MGNFNLNFILRIIFKKESYVGFYRSLLKGKKVKFLLVGALNTVFSYINSILIYFFLNQKVTLIFILIISHLINVTFSFMTNKIFVFNSSNQIRIEYVKFHMVYLGNFLIYIFLLWLLVTKLNIPYWLALIITMLLSVIYSFLTHLKFTFRTTNE
jgi:putative flippase GtrA